MFRLFYPALFLFAGAFFASCEKEADTNRDEGIVQDMRQARSLKRGVSFNFSNVPEEDIPLLGPFVSWSYNWSNTAPDGRVDGLFLKFGMDWCPMAWNNNYSKTGIAAWYQSHPGEHYLLGFNEPNLKDQCNMTPSQAAQYWPEVVEFAKKTGLKIVSPAMNYGTLEGYSDPWKWLDEFFSMPGCSLDDIDAIAVHCYMGSASALKNYINGFKKYGKPIWLTEFCAWDSNKISAEQQMNFMVEAINYLESDPDVERYAWFIPRGNGGSKVNNNLLTSRSPIELTPLGQVFVNMSTMDANLSFSSGDVIPAEHYCGAASIHLEPSTEENGVLDITDLRFGSKVEYHIGLKDTATSVDLRVCTFMDSEVKVLLDGKELCVIAVPNTGREWLSVRQEVKIPAGNHLLTLAGTDGSIRLNWLRINK